MKCKDRKKNTSIKVFIADNNSIFREGLCFLIQGQSDMEVVGEAGDGKTMLHMISQLSPDAVIIDIDLPDMDGPDIIRQITARLPAAKVIALLTHPDRKLVSKIFKAGASGYLLKNCLCDEVEHAIRAVVRNRISLSAERIDNYMKILSGTPVNE